MKNQWQLKSDNSDLTDRDLLIYLKELIDSEPGIIKADIGELGIKTESYEVLDETFPALIINSDESVNYLDLALLRRIPALKDIPQVQIENALGRTRLEVDADIPTLSAIYHAILPGKVSIICMPTALLALDLLEDPAGRYEQTFNGSVRWIESAAGLTLADKLKQVVGPNPTGSIFVHQVGLFVFADSVKAAYNLLIKMINQAGTALNIKDNHHFNSSNQFSRDSKHGKTIATLRKSLSEKAGTPLLMRVLSNQKLLSIIGDSDLLGILTSRPLYKAQAEKFTHGFLLPNALPQHLPADNLILVKDLGLVVTGTTAVGLARNTQFALTLLEAVSLAWAAGDMSENRLEPGELAKALVHDEHDKSQMFQGEVALVTGAASGIGRGCVLSLINRGATVIGLDIDPKIENLLENPAFMGLVCDLKNEAAVQDAVEKTIREFGGLDMVVLNAGIFTKSALIEELQMDVWQRVMNINLDANVTVLREVYPLLKLAPANGRVLVNASRNVPAPGPGAAAYSTSKAGLTQLARVAALEWGKDGIRVNIIHPHAVFDTGIWTDEVLKSRAEKYGVSVKEYKTRNVLKTELTSHDIGELVCEMLGPVFSKTTGAQVPVDGGSDRVI